MRAFVRDEPALAALLILLPLLLLAGGAALVHYGTGTWLAGVIGDGPVLAATHGLGLAVTVVNSVAFLPQALRANQYRDNVAAMAGISLRTPATISLCYLMWVIYAWVLIEDFWTVCYVVVALPSNALTALLVLRARRLPGAAEALRSSRGSPGA